MTKYNSPKIRMLMAYHQTMAQSISSSVIHFFSRTSFETSSNSLQFNLKPISEFKHKNDNNLILTTCCSTTPAAANSTLALTLQQSNAQQQQHWIVVVNPPTQNQESGSSTRQYVVDYYVTILDKVSFSEKDAQGCIYNVSCDTHFGFCCHVDEETSQQLACLPEVISVKPDRNFESVQKDYSHERAESGSYNNIFLPLFPAGSSKHWLVRVEMPESRIITRAQLVDHYTQILTDVLGNEKDAQMCIYNISLQSDYGFCCELDDECAKKLAGVRSVTSVTLDVNVGSDDKDYGDTSSIIFQGPGTIEKAYSETEIEKPLFETFMRNSLQHSDIKTKKVFVTGLSFYTSEKTLRAAFEGFGELFEVKIIMDKISKRSKGFAFIEYTTEEAAGAALREMNGKIINGWMIVVDVAKTNPPKYSRSRPRPVS